MANKHPIPIVLILLISFTSSVLIEHTDEPFKAKLISQYLDKPKIELFKVYHSLYQKNYDLTSEEGMKRFEIFKDNLKFIDESNSQNLGFTLGITKFTDLTREEFKSKYLNGLKDVGKPRKGSSKIEHVTEFPNGYPEINHLAFMSAARNQEDCGSCWAFATTSTVEGNFNKYNSITNPSQKFMLSPQDLLNCFEKSDPCDGYDVFSALNNLGIPKGFLFEYDEQYDSGFTLRKNQCRTWAPRYKFVKDFDNCDECTKQEYFSLLAQGPIAVGVDGEGNGFFQHYTGGIIDEYICGEVDHAVVVFGYNPTDDALLVRNSWGEDWGENGNFRIKINESSSNTCHLMDEAVLPIIQNVPYTLPPPIPPKCMRIYSGKNGLGSTIEVCKTMSQLPFEINSLRAYKAKNKSALFYEQDCRGNSLYRVKGDVHDFLDKGISKVRSIWIDDDLKAGNGCAILYSSTCQTNKSNYLHYSLCEDISDTTPIISQWGYNNIASFKTGENLQGLLLCTGANYTGNCWKYWGESFGLGKDLISTGIKSIRLLR